jgi:ELWxxDGT repeat protein
MASDGTASGTHMLSGDIRDMRSRTPMNGNLYFVNQNSLWVTDGLTTIGTHKVVDIHIDNDVYYYKNKLIFGGYKPGDNGALWLSDGTAAGTIKLKEINSSSNFEIKGLTEVNGKVCFGVRDGLNNSIWVTNGTELGTYKLADVELMYPYYYGTNDNPDLEYYDPVKLYNGKLYFAGNDGIHGTELWETDGTVTGTKMTADINPGAAQSDPYDFAVYKGKLFFYAYNPAGSSSTNVFDIWTLSGESNPPVKITNTPQSFSGSLTLFNDKLYTTAGSLIYETDGTTNGSRIINDSFAAGSFMKYKGCLYFFGSDLTDILAGYNMFRLAGDNSIHKVAISNRNESGREYSMQTMGSSLYFNAAATAWNDDVELYRFDDFPTGVPALVSATNSGLCYPNPASNTFSVKVGSTTNVSVYSLTGQLLLTTHDTQDISIAHLPADIYMVKIDSDGKTSTEKLVKQ